MTRRRTVPLLIVGLVGICALRVVAQDREPSPATGEWPVYHGNLAQQHYSPLDQVDADNFDSLEVAWRFSTDNLGTRPEFNLEGTPLMVGGVLYSTGGTRRLHQVSPTERRRRAAGVFEMTIPHCKPGQTRRDLHGAAACDCKDTIDLGHVELDRVKALYFLADAMSTEFWVYDQTGEVESNCPEDRCGGPYCIPTFCDETEGDKWFMFAIVDCHFPSRFQVGPSVRWHS